MTENPYLHLLPGAPLQPAQGIAPHPGVADEEDGSAAGFKNAVALPGQTAINQGERFLISELFAERRVGHHNVNRRVG